MSDTPGVELPPFSRQRLFDTLQKATGRSYEPYLSKPFEDALRHRLRDTGDDSIDNYLRRLRSDPGEALRLERRALVGVTQFFRDPEAFDALGGQRRRLLHRRSIGEPLRVWVPACSTGQEAYSLAILLQEASAKESSDTATRVVGSDINTAAVEFARQSRFEPREMKSLGETRRRSYFRERDGAFEPIAHVRESVWFMIHDLMDPAPFDEVDVISCRNLLIYLRPRFQQRLLESFAELLRPQGLLFVGKSETTLADDANFTLIDPDHRIFSLR